MTTMTIAENVKPKFVKIVLDNYQNLFNNIEYIMETANKTYPEHECKDWKNPLILSAEYTYEPCRICGKIVWFHYRSFWRRLKAVFLKV